MELAIPLVALGSLYIVSNQKKEPKPVNEGFLPNTNVPDMNYPEQVSKNGSETELSSKLATMNR